MKDISKIIEALERIENKLDIALKLFSPPPLDIKGYPEKSIDWKAKIAYYKSKINKKENV